MSLSVYSQQAGHLICDDLARITGVAVHSDSWVAFACQVKREVADGADWAAGFRFNNPLNLTTGGGRIVWSGQSGTYSGGDAAEWHGDFAAFPTLELGCQACAQNYASPTYAAVVRALVDGPLAVATEIQGSPWDSGHYGGTLTDDVRAELGGQEADMATPEEIIAAVEGKYDLVNTLAAIKDRLAKDAHHTHPALEPVST